MSFLRKQWVIRNPNGRGDLVAKVLSGRDLLNEGDQQDFFDTDVCRLHDPLLMKDMKKAVDRIQTAIKQGENIRIFGDYDVDGMSGTAVLIDFLRKAGAKVDYTLPDREEDGYGLKSYFVENFKEDGVDLLITVDCGTTNVAEIARARALGMEVIVTDHHDPPEVLPEAFALINPKQKDCNYPNKQLSGSAVAYKLITALTPYYFSGEEANEMLYRELGLATLGLVADCMNLKGENRILVTHGLGSLSADYHPGIRALLKKANHDRPVTSSTIGFLIGPRLNAAGRLDKPDHALELLLGDADKADILEELNEKRKRVVEEFIGEAMAQVARGDLPAVIVVSSARWNNGTLGLIAGRLCEQLSRPVIAVQEKEEECVASCRSLNDFDITEFLRREAGDLFTNIGGHMLAGGFTLPREHFSELKKRIQEKGPEALDVNNFYGELNIDCMVESQELTLEGKALLDRLEPFGMGNPQPTLLMQGVQIREVRPVGKTGDHLQLPLEKGGQTLEAIAFRFGQHSDKINCEKQYDIAFQLEVNEWKGRKKVQMRVLDMREAET